MDTGVISGRSLLGRQTLLLGDERSGRYAKIHQRPSFDRSPIRAQAATAAAPQITAPITKPSVR